jgi:hypothetical protein
MHKLNMMLAKPLTKRARKGGRVTRKGLWRGSGERWAEQVYHS